MKLHLLLAVLWIMPVGHASAQNIFVTDSLDAYMVREMSRWKIPGVAVAIVKDGKPVLIKGFGVRKEGAPEKIDEQTLFQVASNTKLFTATCLSLLHQQKKLSLDDKVTKWLPDFRLYDTLATREVTIRDMLTHRIGYLTFQSDFLNWNSNLSRQELINRMRNVKPVYGFRARWGYCNMGYVVAGEIVKQVSGLAWENFVFDHLFKPLGMNRTSVSQAAIVSDSNAAGGHTVINDTIIPLEYANIDNIGPCGSINSSIKDMSTWVLMQLDSGSHEGNRIIPFPAIRETWRSQMIMNDPGNPLFPTKHFSAYGLGLELNDFSGRKVMSHSGGTNGFITQIMFVPEERLGIVVFTNTDANNFYDAFCYQVLESYLTLPYRNLSELYFERYKESIFAQESEIKSWRERTARKPESALPLDRYVGKYNNSVYGDLEIKKENNKLNIYFAHHPKNIGRLEPYGGNEFVCTYSDIIYGVKMITFTTENEKVKTITLSVNDFVDLLPYEFTKLN